MNISYPLIRTRLCGNQGVRNVSFLDNFAYKLNERSQEQINFAKKKKKKKKKQLSQQRQYNVVLNSFKIDENYNADLVINLNKHLSDIYGFSCCVLSHLFHLMPLISF